jgi:dUTP pyrophosphatase
MILKVKKLKENAEIPRYMSEFASGMDVFACLDKPVALKPLARALIPTGIALSIPAGYEVQIRPRSGLAIKHGITLVNSPGTIDADYRGEIKIIMINLGNEDFEIKHGDRIAQMVINKVEKLKTEEVETLDKTDRGEGGFGSTGI